MGEYFSHAAACIIGVQLNDRFLLRKGALKARLLADGYGNHCVGALHILFFLANESIKESKKCTKESYQQYNTHRLPNAAL